MSHALAFFLNAFRNDRVVLRGAAVFTRTVRVCACRVRFIYFLLVFPRVFPLVERQCISSGYLDTRARF